MKKYHWLILTDLQKGFETFNHASLLKKLKPTSLSREVVSWLKPYLSKGNMEV